MTTNNRRDSRHPRRLAQLVYTALGLCLSFASCSYHVDQTAPSPYKMHGPLVSSETTMVTAWYLPKNPITDPALDDSKLSKDIKRSEERRVGKECRSRWSP